jgi:hypothetical protein
MGTAMHTIVAGEGVGVCRIGANKQTAIETFGSPSVEESDSQSGYLQFPQAGVETRFDEADRITHLFLYFRSTSNSTFKGITNLGIGIDSSVVDVLARYGRPSTFAEFTESREKNIFYDSLGIMFSFKDEELIDIRISESRAETWPN